MIRIIILTLAFFAPLNAFAQSQGAAPQSGIMSFLPLVLIFIIFYFFLIRPQQKKSKETQLMLSGLKIGNQIITSSGIYGKIRNIDEKENSITLEISDDVEIKILKSSINQLVKKEESAKLVKKSSKKTSKIKSK